MSEKKSSENVGILGGTFNPPHLGHIRLGLSVQKCFPIDSVRYILSANPPHKSGPEIIAPKLRFSLLERALQPYGNMKADPAELNRATPSWTVLTMERLRQDRPQDRFFFVCGSEAFLAIKSWHRYEELLDMTGFLIYIRNPEHYGELNRLCEKERISIFLKPPRLPKEREITLFSAPSETIAISSTEIRRRIQSGEPYAHLLPKQIAIAIKENKLYARRQ